MLEKISGLDVERIVALVLVIFSIAELTQALQLPLSEEFTLGPGAMPVFYGAGLLIFAVLLWFTASPNERALPERPDERMDEPGRNYPAGITTFLLVVAFVGSIYLIGFLAGTVVFSLLHLIFVMRLNVLKSVTFSLIWGGGLYYLFHDLLSVQLEQGMLFGG